MNTNPYTLSFGKKPNILIDRSQDINEIINAFNAKKPITHSYIITGVRGSGKTVLLTTIAKELENKDDWLVIELNPELDLLESLASKIYEQSKIKFKFAVKEFSFSFSGFTFSMTGEKPISNITTLLQKMLETLNKNGKKILVCIDEISNNEKVKAFIHQFQIFIRKEFNLFLLMTGLYENIRGLQNEKTLTFLYRAPMIQLESLNLFLVADSFMKNLNLEKTEAIRLAKLSKGYAFAYQVLGYISFEGVSKQNLLNEFDNYLRRYSYEKIWQDLPTCEQKILIALAKSKEGKTHEILEKMKMNKETYSPYRSRLIKKGLVHSPQWGTLDFTLPRFKEFILDILLFEEF